MAMVMVATLTPRLPAPSVKRSDGEGGGRERGDKCAWVRDMYMRGFVGFEVWR